MLFIAFEDLKTLAKTSFSGYYASHPLLAVPAILESQRCVIFRYPVFLAIPFQTENRIADIPCMLATTYYNVYMWNYV